MRPGAPGSGREHGVVPGDDDGAGTRLRLAGYELGCPFLYSLNRERSLYNPELSGVSGLLEEFYWPHEIEVLPVSYTRMLDGAPKASIRNRLRSLKRAASPKSNMDYRHLIGWRRVAT